MNGALPLRPPPHVNCRVRHRGAITANEQINDRPVLGEYGDTTIRSHSIQIIIIIIIIINDISATNSTKRIAATLYSLGTQFVSGI